MSSPSAVALPAAERRRAAILWLLEIEWFGRRWRISERAVTVTTAAGEELAFVSGLETFTLTERFGFFDQSGAGASQSFDIIWPDDVSALIAAGADLSAARGVLSRWVEGTTYERRVVYLAGMLRADYGEHGERVGATLDGSPWVEDVTIPLPDWAVIGKAWDANMILSLASNEVGLPYPLVIGTPGRVATWIAESGWVTGSQPVWVDHRMLYLPSGGGYVAHQTAVLSYGHCTAETVYLNTPDHHEGDLFVVRRGYDRAGRPISYVPWYASASDPCDPFTFDAGVSTYFFQDGDAHALGDTDIDVSFFPSTGLYKEIYAGWRDPVAAGGGLMGADGTTMRGAGDVLQWMLALTGQGVDRGRFGAIAPALNRYRLDFTIDAGTTIWDWIRTNLLPLIPLCLATSEAGYYPIVFDPAAARRDAVLLDADADREVRRISPISTIRDQMANDISVTFAHSIRTDSSSGTIRRTDCEEPSIADAVRTVPDRWCTLSQRRYRKNGKPVVVPKTLETRIVYDDVTAFQLCGLQSTIYALAWRRVRYEVPEQVYGGQVRRGGWVRLVDSRVSEGGALWWVEEAEVGSGMLRLSLVWLETVNATG